MASGSTHQMAAAVIVGGTCLCIESSQEEKAGKSVIGAVLAATMTRLPDVLEPATHPNHRQFFHSIAFASLLGIATHKVYRWEPEDTVDKAVRFTLLVGASAYFIHLLLDAGTPKSLPLIGKL